MTPDELLHKLQTAPKISSSVFVAPNATIIGDVTLDSNSSVWFGAVLRGDSDSIRVGSNTNIQDNAVIHADPGFPCIIGENCVIGHSAIVHGAILNHHVVVGMNATILNNAIVGEYSIIGANALIPQGMIVPAYSMVLGVPGKIVKQLEKSEEILIQSNVDEYVLRAQTYLRYFSVAKFKE